MADLVAVHKEMLERWRKAMNLVGPGEIDFHFADCDRAVSWLTPSGHWADLGSGAGFPGLLFAARFPDVTLDLVDSRWKRCVFLEEVLAAAELLDGHVTVHHMRLEELPDASYDGIMARGLASPEQMMAWGTRLLKPGGMLVLLLQAYTDAPVSPHYELVHTESYVVEGKSRKAVGLRLLD